jgi:hypothetical protein
MDTLSNTDLSIPRIPQREKQTTRQQNHLETNKKKTIFDKTSKYTNHFANHLYIKTQ